MSSGAIEIILGTERRRRWTTQERRRRWTTQEKLRIVAETEEVGARIGDVAARHDVYPSLLCTWRCQVREGCLGADRPAGGIVSRGDGPAGLSNRIGRKRRNRH
jgi:transposase-like protein